MKKFLMLALVAGSFGLLGVDYASAATGNGCDTQSRVTSQPTVPAASTAQAQTGRRSYSIQPETAPVYRAPAMRSNRTYGPTNPNWGDAGRKIRGQI